MKFNEWRRPISDEGCWKPMIDEIHWLMNEDHDWRRLKKTKAKDWQRLLTGEGQYVSKALTGEDRWQMNNRRRSLLTHALLKVVENLDWWKPLTDDGGCWLIEGCPLTDDGGSNWRRPKADEGYWLVKANTCRRLWRTNDKVHWHIMKTNNRRRLLAVEYHLLEKAICRWIFTNS